MKRLFSIFIENLPNDVSMEQCIHMFTKTGNVKNCKYFGQKCFIDYNTIDECNKAISTYNGCVIGSKKIIVKYSDNLQNCLQLNSNKKSEHVDVNALNTSTKKSRKRERKKLLNTNQESIADLTTGVNAINTSFQTSSNISTMNKNITVVSSTTLPMNYQKALQKSIQPTPENKLLPVNGVISDNIKIQKNVIEAVDNIESKLNAVVTPITLDINDIFRTADMNSINNTLVTQSINISTDSTSLVSSIIPLKIEEENCQKTLQKLNRPTPKNECPISVNADLDNIKVENLLKALDSINNSNIAIGSKISPPLNPRFLWSDEFIQNFNKIELPLLCLPTCFTCKKPGIYLSECCKKVFFCNHICLFNGFFAHLPFCLSNQRENLPNPQEPNPPATTTTTTTVKISFATPSINYSSHHCNEINFSNTTVFNGEKENSYFAATLSEAFPHYTINRNAQNRVASMKTSSEAGTVEPFNELKNINRHDVMSSSVSNDRLGGSSIANYDHKNSWDSSAGIVSQVNNNVYCAPDYDHKNYWGSSTGITPQVQNNASYVANHDHKNVYDSSTGITSQVQNNASYTANHDHKNSWGSSTGITPQAKNNASYTANHDHKNSWGSSTGITPQVKNNISCIANYDQNFWDSLAVITPQAKNNASCTANHDHKNSCGSSTGITPQVQNNASYVANHDHKNFWDSSTGVTPQVQNNASYTANHGHKDSWDSSAGITPQVRNNAWNTKLSLTTVAATKMTGSLTYRDPKVKGNSNFCGRMSTIKHSAIEPNDLIKNSWEDFCDDDEIWSH